MSYEYGSGGGRPEGWIEGGASKPPRTAKSDEQKRHEELIKVLKELAGAVRGLRR